MAKKSPTIACAAVRSSFDDDGDDDGDEDFDDGDSDPFEDEALWDDLPSISPAGSASSESEGGIASLRSFTDTLRGEVIIRVVVFFLFFPSLPKKLEREGRRSKKNSKAQNR